MTKATPTDLERQVASLIRRLHACKEKTRHTRIVRRKMTDVILEFDTCPEPRSYMSAYNELRSLVEWLP